MNRRWASAGRSSHRRFRVLRVAAGTESSRVERSVFHVKHPGLDTWAMIAG